MSPQMLVSELPRQRDQGQASKRFYVRFVALPLFKKYLDAAQEILFR